jgi:hypothetical protein
VSRPRSSSSWRSLLLAGALAQGCVGPLDSLGYGDSVTETRDHLGLPRLEDDRIQDKHPSYDASRTVVERFDACDVTLNKSATVTRLDIVPFDPAGTGIDGKLFRGRGEALAAAGAAAGIDVLPSMEVVNGHLKPFNDGLYAAVELELEQQKQALLVALLARTGDLLAAATDAQRPAVEAAADLLGAALILGGGVPALDDRLRARAQAIAAQFSANAEQARPIGLYTWSLALQRIFTRDRFLQTEGPIEALATLALLLGQDPDLLAAYQRVTGVYAGLTNPYRAYTIDALIPYVGSTAALENPQAIGAAFASANPSRRPCGPASVAFVPSSRSKEVDYFEEQFCLGLPAGTNLLEVLIDAIRSGALDLAPGAGSGWYDYQQHALETLLLPERGPESQHLLLTAGYKRKLVDTFKSILIQTRETHVKQLGGARATSAPPLPPVDIYPRLAVEPFPTFYVRTARAYRFLRTFLEATLGPELLGSVARVVEPDGRAPAPLGDELDRRIHLLYGLSFVGADAVGMARTEGLLPEELAEIPADRAVAAAAEWLGRWQTDPDVTRDPRVMIPIFYEDRGFTRYWAVVGVKAIRARAEFVPGYEPQIVSATPCTIGKIVSRAYTLLVEESAELRLPSDRPPPTRAELRAVCDAHATKDEIVRALEAW